MVNNGRSHERRQTLGEKAALIEAHTDQQSFESVCQGAEEQHPECFGGGNRLANVPREACPWWLGDKTPRKRLGHGGSP